MVNGEQRPVVDIEPHVTAARLAARPGFTGGKEGCAEGECGACAVMVARPDGDGRTRWTAINACLVPAAALDGQEVVTAEGLGEPGALHPVQEEMADRGGSQCGYCTPGFICSMAAEYYRPDRTPADPSGNGKQAADHEHGPNGFDLHALCGNLCRCTGYRPIRDAAYALGAPPERTRCSPSAAPRPRPPPAPTRVTSRRGRIRPARRPGRGARRCWPSSPDATRARRVHRLGRRAQHARHARAALTIGRRPAARTAARSTSAPTSIDIGAALTLSEAERRWPGGSRCWPRCSRSSRPG